jgi:hypothetical protein
MSKQQPSKIGLVVVALIHADGRPRLIDAFRFDFMNSAEHAVNDKCGKAISKSTGIIDGEIHFLIN